MVDFRASPLLPKPNTSRYVGELLLAVPLVPLPVPPSTWVDPCNSTAATQSHYVQVHGWTPVAVPLLHAPSTSRYLGGPL